MAGETKADNHTNSVTNETDDSALGRRNILLGSTSLVAAAALVR